MAVEKLLERIVNIQMVDFINTNNILEKNQSGFGDVRSCGTVVQSVLLHWKMWRDQNKDVGAVFLELKGAFKTLNKKKLMFTLSCFNILGLIYKWFKDYLDNRKLNWNQ